MTSRRIFLQGGIFSAMGGYLLSPLKANGWLEVEDVMPPGGAIFSGESGTFGVDEIFVVGILEVTDEVKHQKTLSDLRKKHHYFTRLTFSSNDRYRVPYVSSMMDLFLSTPDMKFSALVTKIPVQQRKGYNGMKITGMAPRKNNLSQKKRLDLKIKCYENLLTELKITSSKAKEIVQKSGSPFGPTRRFQLWFGSQVKGIAIKPADSRDSELLQLAQFLSGCVFCATVNKTKSKSKRQLLEELANKLGLPSLTGPSEIKNKFKVITK